MIFVSHASDDAGSAARIKKSLEQRGFRCWKAPEDIGPSEQWAGAITRAIRESAAVIVVVSARSVASPEVSKEITLAMNRRLPIIPLRLDDTRLPDDWEYHFANIQWLDVLDGDLDGACERISRHLGDGDEKGNQAWSSSSHGRPSGHQMSSTRATTVESDAAQTRGRQRPITGSKRGAGYSNSRIMRRCGQLGVPYDRAIASPYFASQGLLPPSLFIQYGDGLKGTIGWGDDTRQLPASRSTPHSLDEMESLLMTAHAAERSE